MGYTNRICTEDKTVNIVLSKWVTTCTPYHIIYYDITDNIDDNKHKNDTNPKLSVLQVEN